MATLTAKQSKTAKITVTDAKLAALQGKFVFTLNAIASLGCILAFVQLYLGWVGWLDTILFLVMCALSLIGITAGYHRYLAHQTFQTNNLVKGILVICGAMAGQGSPFYWVANHRRHHQYSDRSGDPHSPYIDGERNLERWQGLWHAHIGWLFPKEVTNTSLFVKDLLPDPLLRQIHSHYLFFLLLGLLIPAVLGGVISQSWQGMLSGLLWGGLVRLFCAMQGGYVINSLTHVYGRRPFETGDRSANNVWLAFPTGGEAWHNNHHAFPNSAKFGLHWWQIDPGYWVIRTLEAIGLVNNVKVPSAKAIAAKTAK